MGAVAREAGVAVGTAYVHYRSKDELVIAAYLETKAAVAGAAGAALRESEPPDERFRSMWIGVYRHLAADPDQARFLVQVESSPYASVAAAAGAASIGGGPDALALAASEPEMARRLLPLPLEILHEIGLAPAIQLAGRRFDLSPRQLEVIAAACWHGISRPR